MSAPATLARDGARAVSSPDGLKTLAIVGGLAALAKSDGGRANDFFFEHDLLSDDLSRAADLYGQGALLLGSTFAWSLTSLALGDEQSYADSKLMLRSLAVTGLSTLALKVAFDDTRPDGGPYGFPSGHSSMAMAAATTLQELYGYEAGIPAFLAAGLVGLQRLDDSRHDVGDVLFGWALGYTIAHSISRDHTPTLFGGPIGLAVDPELGYVGLSISLR